MAIACETYKIITNCIYIYINSVNWVNRLGLSATPSAIERFSKRKKRQRVNTCTYSKVSRKKKYVQRYISFFRDIGVHVRATILCNVIARGCQRVLLLKPIPLLWIAHVYAALLKRKVYVCVGIELWERERKSEYWYCVSCLMRKKERRKGKRWENLVERGWRIRKC